MKQFPIIGLGGQAAGIELKTPLQIVQHATTELTGPLQSRMRRMQNYHNTIKASMASYTDLLKNPHGYPCPCIALLHAEIAQDHDENIPCQACGGKRNTSKNLQFTSLIKSKATQR